MNSQQDINAAVDSHLSEKVGIEAAQAALTDAMLLALHDALPGFTAALIQHFEAIQPSASQGLAPEHLPAFYRRADTIRGLLDVLLTVPRRR